MLGIGSSIRRARVSHNTRVDGSANYYTVYVLGEACRYLGSIASLGDQ